jgi:hypothetical protein
MEHSTLGQFFLNELEAEAPARIPKNLSGINHGPTLPSSLITFSASSFLTHLSFPMPLLTPLFYRS